MTIRYLDPYGESSEKGSLQVLQGAFKGSIMVS